MDRKVLVLGIILVLITMAIPPLAIPAPKPPGTDPVLEKLDLILQKLERIPPIWSQKIAGADRFVLVMDDLAVLDRETGLVWQKTVSSSYNVSFYDAESICHTDCTSGRYGWRLPTIEELMSLANIDPAAPDHLFPGHPFIIDVTEAGYWTSTTLIDNLAKVVYFDGMGVGYEDKMTGHRLWCVRGGSGHDGKK